MKQLFFLIALVILIPGLIDAAPRQKWDKVDWSKVEKVWEEGDSEVRD